MKNVLIAILFACTNFAFAQQAQTPAGAASAASSPAPAASSAAPAAGQPKTAKKASSVGAFESMAACLAAAKSDKVSGYEPTMHAKGYGPERVKGLSVRRLEGPACADMDVAVGRKWVLLKGNPKVYTRDAKVVYLEECQNTIHDIVFLEEEVATTPVKTTNSVTETVVVNQRVICRAGNRETESIIVDGKAVCPTLIVEAPAKVIMPVTAESSVAHKTTTVAAETCTKDCTSHEEVKVVREEKRADGRCFVQTNLGYKFELRAQAQSGNTMVGLVDPSTNKLIADTKARHIAADLKAPLLADGKPDCDGMQAQLYKSWEGVRKSYELPSSCKLTDRPQQGTRRQQV